MSLASQSAGADLAAFFDTAGFAETVTYGSASIPAIFYTPFEASQMFGQEIANATPAAHIKTSDVAAPARGDVFTREDGTAYNVIAAHPDGTGITLLILSAD